MVFFFYIRILFYFKLSGFGDKMILVLLVYRWFFGKKVILLKFMGILILLIFLFLVLIGMVVIVRILMFKLVKVLILCILL